MKIRCVDQQSVLDDSIFVFAIVWRESNPPVQPQIKQPPTTNSGKNIISAKNVTSEKNDDDDDDDDDDKMFQGAPAARTTTWQEGISGWGVKGRMMLKKILILILIVVMKILTKITEAAGRTVRQEVIWGRGVRGRQEEGTCESAKGEGLQNKHLQIHME